MTNVNSKLTKEKKENLPPRKGKLNSKLEKNMIKGQNQIIKIETNKHAKRMKPNHQN